ncbi:right-handed parallel beta-helix repeat-containing protein [Pseudonocardia humida]|uniref:Right-handed parallel beta-helix repeat-containing protein n=1 Tax=Pseudonocardia humida TaxID=2800819 RepID=A0ABT1A7Y2_9PSEU|nr:right-handed parallel beta-helix repeat-containing protein [Pseudonocardia humida]MCO1659123.1 right-handed parallel beta-helix repeat-containing protein [Pseudonocardia humida]
MPSLVALATAVVAAALTFSPAQPPPGPLPPVPLDGPQKLSLAERTVPCRNSLRDADLINRRIANSRPGDETVFDGTCLVNKTIKLVGGRTYRGGSRTGTVIKQADGANLDAIFASDGYLDNTTTTGLPFALRTLTVDGNPENNPTAKDSIVIRSWQTQVEDIEINGSRRHGVRVTSLSQNGTRITNTQVNGRIASTQINDSGGSGLYVEDPGNSVTDWQFADNYVAGTGGYGVSLDNAAGVDGNYGLRANRIYGTGISDNYIEDFCTVGLIARVQGDAASTISNNRILKFNDGDGTFLRVEGNYGDGKVAVTGNAIRGNGGGVGLDYIKGNANSLEVVSAGNLVTEVAIPIQVGPGVVVSSGQFAALGGI